jgi:hypothetical protein
MVGLSPSTLPRGGSDELVRVHRTSIPIAVVVHVEAAVVDLWRRLARQSVAGREGVEASNERAADDARYVLTV